MINFTKSINNNFGNPYVEVESTIDGAIEANNGKFYLSKIEIENRFESGDFHLVYLQDLEFEKPVEVVVEWTVESHLADISSQHDELFNSILAQHNYTSFAELSIWAQELTNEYYTEANAIKDWYRSTWMAIKEYSETVTEGTATEPQIFIDNLPKIFTTKNN